MAQLIRHTTGYDNVMIYQFDAEWAGKVVAQDCVDTTTSYLNIHFPASDIPASARKLYTRNVFRLLTNVNITPAAMIPDLNPVTLKPLDLSNSILRSFALPHIEYIKNMGVTATLSLSLLQNGRLWGLIICHHYSPKRLPIAKEQAILIAKVLSDQLTLQDELENHQLAKSAYAIYHALFNSFAQPRNLIDTSLFQKLLKLINATGIITIIDGHFFTYGITPSSAQINDLINWLSENDGSQLALSNEELFNSYPAAKAFQKKMSGLLAIGLSKKMTNCIIWLRKGESTTIKWAGDYTSGLRIKPKSDYKLEPRQSFTIANEYKTAYSKPWGIKEIDISQQVGHIVSKGLQHKLILDKTAEKNNASLSNGVLVSYWNSNSVCLYVNEAFATYFERKPDELIGVSLKQFFKPELYSLIFEQINSIITGERNLINIHTLEYLKDTLCHIQISTLNWVNNNAPPKVHITEGFKITFQLQDLTLLENLGVGIILSDHNRKIIYVNQAYETLTGYQLKEVLGHSSAFLQGSKTNKNVINKIKYDLSHNHSFHGEILNYRKDGTSFWNLLTINAILDNSGLPIQFIGLQQDISEQKKLTKELSTSSKRANQLAEAKTTFLANMSHEIRTPINSILGLSQLALNKEMPPDLFSYIDKINQSTVNLLAILNDILDFSKLDNNKLSLNNAPFSLNELISDTYHLFLLSSEKNEIKYTYTIAKDIPDKLIGDSQRLQQVLTNLVGNAIKFTERGSINLSVNSLQLLKNTVTLRFMVKDTGIGISSSDRHKLLQPFSQADTTISRRFGGSGLGLAICEQLLKLMGSHLEIESTHYKGSEFYFDISLKPDKTLDNDNERRTPNRKGGVISDTLRAKAQRLQGKTVLVAEDNLLNQTVITEFLNLCHIESDLANNGQEALTLISNKNYDLVLMDINMPIMSGITATRIIREHILLPDLPIIALSAGVSYTEREESQAAGMSDFLAKPITAEELINKLLDWLLPSTASSTSPEEPIINTAELEQLVGDNQHLIGQLKSKFLNELLEKECEIAEQLLNNQLSDVKKLVHHLSGSAAIMGATMLCNACKALESSLSLGNNDQQIYHRFTEALQKTLKELTKEA